MRNLPYTGVRGAVPAMGMINAVRSIRSEVVILGVLMALLPSGANAVTQELRAVFKPDPSNPRFYSGQPVKQHRLMAGTANALSVRPGFYVDRKPGILHFEVPRQQMDFMLQPGAGSSYSGRVAVIWDSEV